MMTSEAENELKDLIGRMSAEERATYRQMVVDGRLVSEEYVVLEEPICGCAYGLYAIVRGEVTSETDEHDALDIIGDLTPGDGLRMTPLEHALFNHPREVKRIMLELL